MPEETFGDACQKTGGKIMTKLDCSVTGCMHNAENCCCKNTILVEGKTAQDKCDTCCGSFDEKKGIPLHPLDRLVGRAGERIRRL